MNFLVMPLFFLSGALFPLNLAPSFLQTIARIDPLSYGVDALRFTTIGASTLGFGQDILILTVLTTIVLAIGSYLFSRIQA